MDRKKLEKETYAALKNYFNTTQEEKSANGKLYCEIPPEILNYVLESLVTPVVTTILADYLIRKWQSIKDKKDIAELEKTRGSAIKRVGELIKKTGMRKNKAEEICNKISTTVIVDIKVSSEKGTGEVLGLLKEILSE